MRETTTHKMTTVKIYVPDLAAETDAIAGDTVMDVIKRRAAEAYGGFTTYDGKGGWLHDGNTQEENVTVVEVHASETANTDPQTWAEVNARYIRDMTNEQMAIVQVGGQLVEATA